MEAMLAVVASLDTAARRYYTGLVARTELLTPGSDAVFLPHLGISMGSFALARLMLRHSK